MTTTPNARGATGTRRATLASLTLLGTVLVAQDTSTTPVPSPEQLARYDLDKNGTLEGAELDAFRADQTKVEEEILELSPFFITTKQDRGYFAENTLAGSRMNTKISDLGASISVVTKRQMEDFASYNVNDVFRYEVNTEGSSTYTPQTATFRNDGILDVNAGGTLGNSVSAFTNATANRVRGLAVPTASINYYQSIAAIPPDSYNTQSFEISRGPNSLLFGLGSPAGVVNQSTAQADPTKNTARLDVSMDDRGSFRSSLAFNRTLIDNKLAIYGAFLYDDQQFERKPSYDTTRRQYGAVTYKPLKKTALSFNFENYNNHNRRPNTVSPIDYITQWDLAGRPTYDALTKQITYLSTGEVVGPYVSSASSPWAQNVRDYIRGLSTYNPALRGGAPSGQTLSDTNFSTYNGNTIFGQTALNPALSLTQRDPRASVLHVPGLSQVNQGRSLMQIGPNGLTNWFSPLYTQSYRVSYRNPSGGNEHQLPIDPFTSATQTASTAALWANSTWADVYNRDYFQSNGWTNNQWITNVGGYKYPGVTDRSVFDWKKINVNGANFGEQENQSYNFELQQELAENLYLSAGWFRQDFEQVSNYTIAQLNATAIRVDVNRYLPDGTANPYFGLPFVNDFDPDRYDIGQVDDHFRVMLGYTPDFTKSDGWLRHLGHHQMMAMWSRDETMIHAIRNRLNYVGAGSDLARYRYLPNPNDSASGANGWNYQGGGSLQRLFYLANPGDPIGVASRRYSTWDAQRFSGNIRMYDYANSRFTDAPVDTAYNMFDAPTRSQRLVQSLNFGISSYFWNDRIVTTFGIREDKLKNRQTTTGAIVQADGTVLPALTAQQKWNTDGYFNKSSVWNRFGQAQWMKDTSKTGGGVIRPFSGWSSVENNANSGSQLWQIIRDFGFSYNWSDNFNPPAEAQVDLFGRPLGKPGGVGRDYGFQFAALDGKLFARVTWFKATNMNERIAAGGAALNRVKNNVDETLFRNWARTIVLINRGYDPTLSTFGSGLDQATEQAVRDEASQIWGLPYNYYGDIGSTAATGEAVAKGMEIQLNYNTDNWRNRFTFGKQETKYSNVLVREFQPWVDVRMPIWMSARAADYMNDNREQFLTYTTVGGTQVDLTNFWSSYGYDSAVRLTDQFGNTNVERYYANNVTPQVTLSRDLNGQAAPNQRKYRWAYNTGYDFTSGFLKGVSIGGAERWESKMVIGYYGKASGSVSNPQLLDVSDVTRPIYDKAQYYTDIFVKYRRNLWADKVAWTLQLNVVNAFEGGGLRVVAVNYDGSPYGYRIVDSRKFVLTSTFEF